MASLGTEAAAASGGDGPVLSMMSKRLRALRKKYNRILQMEERVAQGKPLNKEQEEVLRSKPAVAILIDEYEKLRQPLAAAVEEELARAAAVASPPPPALTLVQDEPPASPTVTAEKAEEEPDLAVKDLVTLLYFGCLFDVKSQSEFAATMLTKTHERGCCLTYDYVTDDATDLLGERDLDEISVLGSLVTSRPVYSGVSHKNALHECLQQAKLWLQNADQPIHPEASITYAGLREKLNKILASDYFTTTPEMKAPGDVAAAVGKYGASCEVQTSDSTAIPSPMVQTESSPILEDGQQEFQMKAEHQVSIVDEHLNMEEADLVSSPIDVPSNHQEQQKLDIDVEEQNQDIELKEQQPTSRRSYHNQRGGTRGGGRRGYANGRGGRGGRGGNGGYQNGRGQYYESGYYPRNYYNSRGRGGRSGGSAMYTNHGGSHGGYISADVE
ncbi:hypothetical protein Cni_G28462 [Canna indica]|uniref:Glycine-rich protein n=1 Tax=Canna indica TaxID=4628 RepID=A0AAQ3L3E4_9LILI|nr:hypothetical protein Cni_G28462 [Canna indica]